VQLKYERSRASELTHLFRLVLLVASVWLNNGTYALLFAHQRARVSPPLVCRVCVYVAGCPQLSVFYLAYRVHTEVNFDDVYDGFSSQVSKLFRTWCR
jgi:primosomal protein N'